MKPLQLTSLPNSTQAAALSTLFQELEQAALKHAATHGIFDWQHTVAELTFPSPEEIEDWAPSAAKMEICLQQSKLEKEEVDEMEGDVVQDDLEQQEENEQPEVNEQPDMIDANVETIVQEAPQEEPETDSELGLAEPSKQDKKPRAEKQAKGIAAPTGALIEFSDMATEIFTKTLTPPKVESILKDPSKLLLPFPDSVGSSIDTLSFTKPANSEFSDGIATSDLVHAARQHFTKCLSGVGGEFTSGDDIFGLRRRVKEKAERTASLTIDFMDVVPDEIPPAATFVHSTETAVDVPNATPAEEHVTPTDINSDANVLDEENEQKDTTSDFLHESDHKDSQGAATTNLVRIKAAMDQVRAKLGTYTSEKAIPLSKLAGTIMERLRQAHAVGTTQIALTSVQDAVGVSVPLQRLFLAALQLAHHHNAGSIKTSGALPRIDVISAPMTRDVYICLTQA